MLTSIDADHADCAICLAQRGAADRAQFNAWRAWKRAFIAAHTRTIYGYGSHDAVLALAPPPTPRVESFERTTVRYALKLPFMPVATFETWYEAARCPSAKHRLGTDCECVHPRDGRKPQYIRVTDAPRSTRLPLDLNCRKCGVFVRRAIWTPDGRMPLFGADTICDACLPSALNEPTPWRTELRNDWVPASNMTPAQVARTFEPLACCGHPLRAHENDEASEIGFCRLCDHAHDGWIALD